MLQQIGFPHTYPFSTTKPRCTLPLTCGPRRPPTRSRRGFSISGATRRACCWTSSTSWASTQLLLYLYAGLRRREIIQLHWGDIVLDGERLTLATQTKGGLYRSLEVTAPSALAALRDYLVASDRWGRMTEQSPLWLAHDRAV